MHITLCVLGGLPLAVLEIARMHMREHEHVLVHVHVHHTCRKACEYMRRGSGQGVRAAHMWSFEYSHRLASTTACTEHSTTLRMRAMARKSACPSAETPVTSGGSRRGEGPRRPGRRRRGAVCAAVSCAVRRGQSRGAPSTPAVTGKARWRLRHHTRAPGRRAVRPRPS